jgi:hypothetical protein
MGNWTYSGVKQPGPVNLTDFFPASVEVRNKWTYNSFSPYAFLLWTGSTYRISALLANKVKGPWTVKQFTQQCVTRQKNVSILDTIRLRKLQYLGKCHKEI